MVVEVALQWCTDTFSDLMVGFVNSVKTIDGGTHIEGFKVRQPSTLSHMLKAILRSHTCLSSSDFA